MSINNQEISRQQSQQSLRSSKFLTKQQLEVNGLVIQKLIQKYAKNNQAAQHMIIRMVTDFTEHNLINDQNLKQLEVDVQNTISQLPKPQKSKQSIHDHLKNRLEMMKSQQTTQKNDETDAQSIVSKQSERSKHSSQSKQSQKSQLSLQKSMSVKSVKENLDTLRAQSAKNQNLTSAEKLNNIKSKLGLFIPKNPDIFAYQNGQNDDLISITTSSTSTKGSIYGTKNPNQGEWVNLLKYQQLQYERDLKAEEKRKQDEKRRMYQEYQAQMEIKRQQLEQEKQQKIQDGIDQIKNMDMYDTKKGKYDNFKNTRIKKDTEVGQKIFEDLKARRNMEKKMDKCLDKLILKKCKQEQKEDEEKYEQDKKNRRIQGALDAERLREIYEQKNQQLKDELKQDQFYQNQYKELHEREQAMRDAKQKTLEKYWAGINEYEQATAKNYQRNEQFKEEFTTEDQNKINAKIQQEIEEKKEKLKKQQAMLTRVYNDQIQQKKEQQQFEKTIDQKQADLWQKDKEIYVDQVKGREEFTRNLNKNVQEFLEKQNQEKKFNLSQQKKLVMDKNELKLNKKILKKLNQDEEF